MTFQVHGRTLCAPAAVAVQITEGAVHVGPGRPGSELPVGVRRPPMGRAGPVDVGVVGPARHRWRLRPTGGRATTRIPPSSGSAATAEPPGAGRGHRRPAGTSPGRRSGA